jgi:PAS domain S-box-containing protein
MVTDAILVCDRQGRILGVNQAACRQLDYLLDELLGRSLSTIPNRLPRDIEVTRREDECDKRLGATNVIGCNSELKWLSSRYSL